LNIDAGKKHSVFEGVEIGIGTWAWGDRLFWGYGRGYDETDLRESFQHCLDQKVVFVDTAEVYGQGRSESILGGYVEESGADIRIATKFSPFPWRLTRSSFLSALRGSLKRLHRDKVELYQVHVPLPPVRIQAWMESMAEAQQNGLIDAAGVSNFNREQMQQASDVLARYGMRLASNQVEYHLLDRTVEKNGLLSQCEQMGIALIAYSPIAKGILSGKYSPNNPVRGFRENKYNRRTLEKIQPIIKELRKIGMEQGGKTPSQVAINWVICKGAIPIPGVKNLIQSQENLGSVGWRLSEEQVAILDDLSDRILKP
jgi:aryl-alcohol dehydrogenase-like predicted oxidoreductase